MAGSFMALGLGAASHCTSAEQKIREKIGTVPLVFILPVLIDSVIQFKIKMTIQQCLQRFDLRPCTS